jgi:hypothetical protein
MMNEEEKLNDIINSKFSEEEFPFDEENWEKAEKLIDDSRKKKKRRIWMAIFFIGLVSGIVIMIPFVSNEYKSKRETAHLIKENENAINIENKDKTQLKEKTFDLKKQDDTSKVYPKSVGQNKDVSLSASNNGPEQQTIVKIEQKNKNGRNNISNALAVTTKTDLTEKKVVAKIKKSRNPKSEINNNALTSIDNSNIKKIEKSDQIIPVMEEEIRTENLHIVKKEKRNISGSNKIDAQKPVSQNENLIPITELETQKAVSQSGTQNATDSTKNHSEIPAANADSTIKKADTLTIAVTSNTVVPQIEKEKNVRKNMFSIEAGASFIAGWSYGDTTEGRGFNPIFGLGYTRILNSNWSVHTAVYYNTISRLNSSSYTAHHINYDFGHNTIDTSITTKWLHYITVPVQLQYNLNAKNYIGAGMSLSYLITSSGTMSTFNQTPFAITNKKEMTQSGYCQGFNMWNATAMILYGRKLSNRFSINLIAYYGLTDLKENAFFSKQKTERDMGARILLSYNIFK